MKLIEITTNVYHLIIFQSHGKLSVYLMGTLFSLESVGVLVI